MLKYEQLSFFNGEEKAQPKESVSQNSNFSEVQISYKVRNSFSITELPFLGCDFDSIYPALANIIPKEYIVFSDFPLNVAISCEIICAAICHQMNWDYLRNTIFMKVTENNAWVSADNLTSISEAEVFEMFAMYSKPERIRKKERTTILHEIGKWMKNYQSVEDVFLRNNELLDNNSIRYNLLTCSAFSNDPEEKKMSLLLQKLSAYVPLMGLSEYYQPAIDYHLIRCYLRRGLLYAKTKYAVDYLQNSNVERKESTVAAVRELCSKLLSDICNYTNLNISIVNQIEWNIGRSVCTHDSPDCFLELDDSKWLRPKFEVCPFFNTCAARHHNKIYLQLNEPKYTGSSY